MSARWARRVASTASAAVALVLTSAGLAQALPPTCETPPPQTVVEGSFLSIDAFLLCSDPEGSPLTFEISTPPAHGFAGVFGGGIGYGPAAGYTGPDEFAFTAFDGAERSAPVTVKITVTPNQPPDCPASVPFEAEPDVPTTFDPRLECDDDGFILGGAIVDAPEHGTLAPFDFMVAGFLYTPEAGYRGPDTFTVTVRDNFDQVSDPMLVEVTVLEPNRAPTCVTPVTVRVPAGGRMTLDHRNTCTDPDGDELTATLVNFPAHGHFEFGVPPTVDFVADPGYIGADRFVYRVLDDRGGASNDAVVELVIGDPQPQTQAQAQTPDLAAPQLELARPAGQKLAAVRRRGLRLRIASDEAGQATIALSVTKRTARRLGIDRKATGPVVVGRATKMLTAGANEVVVKLSKRAKRRLASAKRVTVLVVVSGRDAAGNTTRETLRLSLAR